LTAILREPTCVCDLFARTYLPRRTLPRLIEGEEIEESVTIIKSPQV